MTTAPLLFYPGRTLATPGALVWALTEADRSATTILLPGEY